MPSELPSAGDGNVQPCHWFEGGRQWCGHVSFPAESSVPSIVVTRIGTHGQ